LLVPALGEQHTFGLFLVVVSLRLFYSAIVTG
jgi:hypothetical protein